MLLLGCFATCAGSTGGGIKMVRMLLLLKQARRELVRIVHPSVVNPVVFGGAAVDARVMQSVIAYMMMYGATLVGAEHGAGVQRARPGDRVHRRRRPA